MMDAVEEILDLGVDGIDISETVADPTFGQNLSYDVAANVAFSNRYPGVTIGVGDWEEKWVDFRSEVFTSNIYQRAGELIRARTNVAYHVTSSIPVDSDGAVKAAHTTSENTGFDWNRVLDLPEAVRPDVLVGQFLWQQQVVLNCDTITFTPDWSKDAFLASVSRTRERTLFVSHPQISTAFATNTNCPSIGPITPTASQFESSMFHGMTNSAGADFYSHHLIDTSAEESAVSNVFFNTP